MDTSSKRKKNRPLETNSANTQTTSPTNINTTYIPTPATYPPPTYPQPQPTVSPEVRDELTSMMQELLVKTHELSFEYSTLDCEDIQQCPLAKKAKELFRVVKSLNEFVRKMQLTPTKGSHYVS